MCFDIYCLQTTLTFIYIWNVQERIVCKVYTSKNGKVISHFFGSTYPVEYTPARTLCLVANGHPKHCPLLCWDIYFDFRLYTTSVQPLWNVYDLLKMGNVVSDEASFHKFRLVYKYAEPVRGEVCKIVFEYGVILENFYRSQYDEEIFEDDNATYNADFVEILNRSIYYRI